MAPRYINAPHVQEVSAHKAAKKEMAHARSISRNVETMKAEITKRDQQLTRWRTENASLKKKLVSMEATLRCEGHIKVMHAPTVERGTVGFHVSQESASFEPIANSILPQEQVV